MAPPPDPGAPNPGAFVRQCVIKTAGPVVFNTYFVTPPRVLPGQTGVGGVHGGVDAARRIDAAPTDAARRTFELPVEDFGGRIGGVILAPGETRLYQLG